MVGMFSYTKAAMERAMKVQEVILRALARKITWYQAAEILGISDRHMRRWRERYEEFGYDGLFDRRRGQPSPKRVPLAVVEQVLGLYRERYHDLNVRHFHEKLGDEHQIELSYSWVKQALQGGAGGAGAQAGSASQAASTAAVAGDAVAHRRQPAPVVSGRALVRPDRDSGRCQQRDLLRAVGGGRIDADGDGRAERSDRAERRILRLVQRPWQPLLANAEGGRESGSASTDAGGTGVARVRHSDDSRLLAPGTGTERAQLRHLAGPAAAGVAAGRDHDCGGGEWFSAPTLHGRVQSPLSGGGGASGQRLCSTPYWRSGSDLCPAVPAHGEPRQHGQFSESKAADRSGALARQLSGLHRDRASTPGRNHQSDSRTTPTGPLQRSRCGPE